MAASGDAPLAQSRPLHGVVVMHGGIERRSGFEGAAIDALLLRLVLSSPTASGTLVPTAGAVDAGSEFTFELHLMGCWAAALHTLEPGDALDIDSALPPSPRPAGDTASMAPPETDEPTYHWWQLAAEASVCVTRGPKRASIDRAALQAGELPEWLRVPSTRPVDGAYRYIRFLCTLRDSIEVNLWAVVWETAKPIGMYDGRPSMNVIIVDRSYERVPCAQWSSNALMPQYSLQLQLPASAVPLGHGSRLMGLPLFTVGDVVRVHRARVTSKPPRFLNVRMQKHSSLITFDFDDVDDAEPAAASSAPPQWRKITVGEHTVGAADHVRAAALRSWARRRLSSESLSNYLVLVADLAMSPTHRDVVVKVARINKSRSELVVADGSTEAPVTVDVSESPLAAEWLLGHVRVGHWLKLRFVSVAYSGDAEALRLRVNAATVTRLPAWCKDVVDRSVQTQMVLAQIAAEMQSPVLQGRVAPDAAPSSAPAVGASHVVAPPSCVPPAMAPAAPKTSSASAPPAKAPAASNVGALDSMAPPASASYVMAPPAPAAGASVAVSSSSGAASPTGPSRGTALTGEAATKVEPGAASPATRAAILRRVSVHRASKRQRVQVRKPEVNAVKEECKSEQPRGGVTPHAAAVSSTHTAASAAEAAVPTPVIARARSDPAHLHTVCATDAAGALQIREVSALAARGERCCVIGSFLVAGVAGSHSDTASVPEGVRVPVEDLLCLRCRVCGHSYAWNEAGTDLLAARHRRHTLPCGHMYFRREFHFRMLLRDGSSPENSLVVAVADVTGEFFNMAPSSVAEDASCRQLAQEMLNALIFRESSFAAKQASMNLLAMYRVYGPASPAGAWVVCDTSIQKDSVSKDEV